MLTRLDLITSRAEREPAATFNNLYSLLTVELLELAFRQLQRDKAPWTAGVTVQEYEEHLQANLQDLATRLHRQSYRPQPSLRRDIPKGNGKTRPLGIACVEDKLAILQPCKARFNASGVVGRGERALVLSGHLDTVPPNQGRWTYGPFNPTVADGKVYGLGASDLHASIVGAYFASLFLRDAQLPGRLVTAFTIEEETTGDGTQGFLDWAERERFLDFTRTQCVVTEPTGLDHLCLGNRGSVFLVLRVTGLGGHGSRPQLSRNPIDKLRTILDGLRTLQEAGQ